MREYETKVIKNKIYGRQEKNNKLYMIVWQRLANSGINYIWAKDETKALQVIGYSPKFVKHTVVQINPENMPVEAGTEN